MTTILSKIKNFFGCLFNGETVYTITIEEYKTMTDLHYIAKMYDPKTGEYVGKYDFVLNEIVGEEEPKEEHK